MTFLQSNLRLSLPNGKIRASARLMVRFLTWGRPLLAVFGAILLYHEVEVPDLAGAFTTLDKRALEGAAAERQGVRRHLE